MIIFFFCILVAVFYFWEFIKYIMFFCWILKNLKVFFSKSSQFLRKKRILTLIIVKLPLQTKRKHLRKQKIRKKYKEKYRTGFIRWWPGFICRQTVLIRPVDETRPLADEANLPANEPSLFGPYIFAKLALRFFFNCLFFPVSTCSKKVE